MNPKFELAVRTQWPDKADRILAIIRGNRAHALTYKAAETRDRQSYHPHDTWLLKLEALSEVVDGACGIEHIPAGRGARSPQIEYLNMGDPYVTTILFFPDRMSWRVGCWGDIVERGQYD